MDETLTVQQVLDVFKEQVGGKLEKLLDKAILSVNEYSTREDAAQPDAFLEFITLLMADYLNIGAEIMIHILQDRHMLCTKCVAPTGDT